MFDDLTEKTESCGNCWWSSGRQPEGDSHTIYCAYYKLRQGVYMWCSKWVDRWTRQKEIK